MVTNLLTTVEAVVVTEEVGTAICVYFIARVGGYGSGFGSGSGYMGGGGSGYMSSPGIGQSPAGDRKVSLNPHPSFRET